MVLAATHMATLEYVTLDELKARAVDGDTTQDDETAASDDDADEGRSGSDDA